MMPCHAYSIESSPMSQSTMSHAMALLCPDACAPCILPQGPEQAWPLDLLAPVVIAGRSSSAAQTYMSEASAPISKRENGHGRGHIAASSCYSATWSSPDSICKWEGVFRHGCTPLRTAGPAGALPDMVQNPHRLATASVWWLRIDQLTLVVVISLPYCQFKRDSCGRQCCWLIMAAIPLQVVPSADVC